MGAEDSRLRLIAAIGLVTGAVLRAWHVRSIGGASCIGVGLDGTALVVAALLTIHHSRRGNELAAAGFLVFVAGEALILSARPWILRQVLRHSRLESVCGLPRSLSSVHRESCRPRSGLGPVAALLFTVVAVRIFLGESLTPLSQPLPFFAYPFRRPHCVDGRGPLFARRGDGQGKVTIE